MSLKDIKPSPTEDEVKTVEDKIVQEKNVFDLEI